MKAQKHGVGWRRTSCQIISVDRAAKPLGYWLFLPLPLIERVKDFRLKLLPKDQGERNSIVNVKLSNPNFSQRDFSFFWTIEKEVLKRSVLLLQRSIFNQKKILLNVENRCCRRARNGVKFLGSRLYVW